MGGGTGTTMIDSGCRSSTRRYRTTRTGKLFFCFNSRFFSSSSSMNISSRSILSPARHHPHPLSLSASLSRRLRTDGSLKGGQSPMFPTNTASNSKKRTSGALDNPEPSSPKVTCIGQVRVKSKKKKNNNNKHGRKLRNPSRRRSGGDGSFRRTDNWGSIDLSSSSQSNILPENKHRNQRWVHLPLTICEGLKGLGAEISCFLPCRSSSCFSSERGSKRERSIRSNLEEIEISREKFEANKLDTSDVGEEEDEEKLSVCVPPKNALLLMRCRSDPMRMAALSRRLLESPLSNGDEPAEGNNNVHEDADFEETEPKRCSQANAYLITPVLGGVEGNENLEADSVIDMPEEHFDVDSSAMGEELEEESEQRKEEPPPLEEEENIQRGSTMEEEEEDIQRSSTMEEEEEEDIQRSSTMEEEEEDSQRSSTMEEEEEGDIQRDSTMEEEEEDIQRDSTMEEEEEGDSLRGSTMMNEEEDIQRGLTMEEEEKEDILRGSTMKEEEEDIFRGSTMEGEEEEENEMDAGPLSASGNEDEQKKFIEEEKKEEERESASSVRSSDDDDLEMESTKEEKAAATNESEEEEVENEEEEEEEEDDDPAAAENEREMAALPDCLLLMMCEPKVSMEVSKETWVCSNDFRQFLPERRRRPANQTLGGDVENKKVIDRSRKAAAAADELNLKQAQQPPRSSCSIPEKAAPLQKLPRCKSEPMRTAAAKLVPSSSETSSCVWKIRKVEQPLRRGPTAVGLVGGSATGLGF